MKRKLVNRILKFANNLASDYYKRDKIKHKGTFKASVNKPT